MDGFNENLDGVFAGHELDDSESLFNNSDSKVLLTRVSTMEHERSDESFNNGALGLSEFLDLPSTSSVWDEDLTLNGRDSNVILEADIIDLNFRIIVFTKELELSGEALSF